MAGVSSAWLLRATGGQQARADRMDRLSEGVALLEVSSVLCVVYTGVKEDRVCSAHAAVSGGGAAWCSSAGRKRD